MNFKIPSEIQHGIAQRARQRRKDLKLSQEDLATKSGVSFGSVKRFERTGKIALESLLKLAMVMDGLSEFDQLLLPKLSASSLDEILKKNT
ncbi:MAG: transcriptional regulator with XRE-family HTH domain [Marinoscillum sp.]|jgi:transcriptional regulator with XRE-family HTH domain